jgi:hypothetical protein
MLVARKSGEGLGERQGASGLRSLEGDLSVGEALQELQNIVDQG